MLIIECFNHNVYIDDKLVGYITTNAIYINGHKFATLTDDGQIYFGEKKIGYVDDDYCIIVNNKEVGYIDGDNNFVFTRAISEVTR